MDKDGALMFVLVFLTVCGNSVAGSPRAWRLSMWDGEVALVWDPPVNGAALSPYSVQMSKYSNNWQNVTGCTMVRAAQCDLTSLIDSFHVPYRVRVHTVTAEGVSQWSASKKFHPNESKLRPPSSTLLATSSSLSITVQENAKLAKLFLFGVIYTIYLKKSGKLNQTTQAFLDDDMSREDVCHGCRTYTFNSLSWGREYCVALRVQGKGAVSPSDVSAPQCVVLPPPVWHGIVMATLFVLGGVASLAVLLFVLCRFMRREEKTPLSLKSPETFWAPLTVGEGSMEFVTDKGWLLCKAKAPLEGWGDTTPGTLEADVPETEWKNERRTSMDSGVSVGSGSATKRGGGDSGCVSIGGSQGAESGGEECPPQGRTHAGTEGETEDAVGHGRGRQSSCSSSSAGQDSGFRPEQTRPDQGAPAGYRDGAAREVRADWPLVSVVTGYRKEQLPCAAAVGDGDGEPFATNYRRKTHVQMETVVSVDDTAPVPLHTPPAEEEGAPPLFLPLTFLPSGRADLGLLPISLCDVELGAE